VGKELKKDLVFKNVGSKIGKLEIKV